MMITPLPPGVYKLVHANKTGYYLEFSHNRFNVRGKNYGNINNHVDLFWSRFTQGTSSMGVMLTGSAGSGKTRVAEIIGNIAIDNNMCVVMVTDIQTDITLIPYLANLHNMIIIFDEFSKNFTMRLQNKMLTMFSSIGPLKKMFIITENDRRSISPYIRTRPGRVRYAVDYDRIDKDTIVEYCNDYSVHSEFLDEIMDLHARAPKFTFDHLQALVIEWVQCEGLIDMDKLLAVLNLDDLVTPARWGLAYGISNKDGSKWIPTDNSDTFSKEDISNTYFMGRGEMIIPAVLEGDKEIVPEQRTYIRVSGSNFARLTADNTYVFTITDMDVYYKKVE